MSRLDSAIRRLQAQRASLDLAAELVRELPGPVFELGLGNGRTFDHLRILLPDRDIYVFERKVTAHPDCVPDARHLVLGDLRRTLPAAAERFGRVGALVHSDIGTGDATHNAEAAAFLSKHLSGLVRPGGIVVSDQALALSPARALAPPPSVGPERYFLYRVA